MGAIAVSKTDERQIDRLRKDLGIVTKSGVIRAALKELEAKAEEERLRREIEESVRRCARADREENRQLFPAAVARRTARS
jgi:hypothetical protein